MATLYVRRLTLAISMVREELPIAKSMLVIRLAFDAFSLDSFKGGHDNSMPRTVVILTHSDRSMSTLIDHRIVSPRDRQIKGASGAIFASRPGR
jgi:hypothetical protein